MSGIEPASVAPPPSVPDSICGDRVAATISLLNHYRL